MPSTRLDGTLPLHIHLLGVGGAGMSGVARILHTRGHVLTGHDRAHSRMLSTILDNDVLDVSIGDSRPEHLPGGAELVVRSAAVREDDPQVVRALELGIPVLKYAELLPRLAPAEHSLAVAGTHGKTSTAWLLLHALVGVRLSRAREGRTGSGPMPAPGALIGGLCHQLETSALAGEPGGWFVLEACEYDRSFLRLAPRAAVITNVEAEHLDYYGSEQAIHEAFARFADRVHPEGLLIVGPNVPELVEDAARCTVWRLGRELDVQLVGESRGGFRFRLVGPGWATPEITLRIPGHHNVENAALALALAAAVTSGLRVPAQEDLTFAAEAIAAFEGAARRFERWGTEAGVDVVHDYAHHPTEVSVTLEAARRVFPGREIHVLFQPHQHSRTARFLGEFVESLRGADRVVVTDVYGARTHIDGGRRAGAPELVEQLRAARVDASLGGDLRASIGRFTADLPEGSAALVLGAGDIEEARDELFGQLALRSARKR
jgi:UDP-N-acetylmuramate--alanine ligase